MKSSCIKTSRTSLRTALGLGTLALAALAIPAAHADSQVTGYVNHPTTNSTDFKSAVTANGDSVNSNVNFDAEAVGPNVPTFYTASDGVTITSSGLTTSIKNGAGPGQGNNFSGPLSPGEGLHAPSHFLFVGGSGSLTLSFASPVAGVGLSTIDLFNPNGRNPISITAFSGANGTGTNLGAFSAVGDNFQNNNLYFMGAADSTGANTIGSLVLTDPGFAGDQIGIDDVLIARAGAPVPEASTTVSLGLLLALGMGGIVMAAKRKKRA